MSVGDNAHYVIDRIGPRHFMQDAARAGLPRGTMNSIFDELLGSAPAALAAAANAMPNDCPAALIDSIAGGFQRRLAEVEKRPA